MEESERREIEKGMDELEVAAKKCGIQEGSQMSRFLLWVGNEVFEGREVSSLLVLTARAGELVEQFLAQDRGDR